MYVNGLTDALCTDSPKVYNGSIEWLGYIWLTPGHLRLLEFVRSYPRTEEVLQAFQELIDQTLRFSTCFVSESVRLSSSLSECARCVCLGADSRVNLILYHNVPTPWSLGDSPARLWPSRLVWSGVDGFVQGTCRPHPSWRSSLVESEIKVIEELGMSLSGRVFMASQGCPGRDLVAGKQCS